MTLRDIKAEFPRSTNGFMSWFITTYGNVNEKVFNDAPLDHQIIAIHRFLGYELELSDSVTLMDHKKVAFSRLKNYENILQESENDITFTNVIHTLTKQEIIGDFESHMIEYRNTIKDALVDIVEPQAAAAAQPAAREDMPLQTDEDDFWKAVKPETDTPF